MKETTYKILSVIYKRNILVGSQYYHVAINLFATGIGAISALLIALMRLIYRSLVIVASYWLVLYHSIIRGMPRKANSNQISRKESFSRFWSLNLIGIQMHWLQIFT